MQYRFSIIIALAPERKIEVLDSLKKSNFDPKKYEVIVEFGLNPSENRNKGIEKAKGEILAFIDDDVSVHEDLLKNADKFLNTHPEIDVVGGPQLTPKNDPFFAKASGVVLSSFLGTYVMSNRYKRGKLNLNADESSMTSAVCFVRKKVFDKIAGFNPLLFPGEDPELFARMKDNGIRMAYNPDLIVYHRRRPNYWSFCKQFFLYGKVRIFKEKINKKQAGLVFFMPSLFSLYVILLIPLYFVYNPLLIPFLIYTAIVIVYSVFLSIQKNLLYLSLLPFLFLSIHMAYGLGMLYSQIKGK
ncbi:glycosyltransferase [Candidatus Woesearchaeota archaeon]|nr:glycosyltransferase [Candidatus Woesearchaeota archaeon]